jgi:hypothetical protein
VAHFWEQALFYYLMEHPYFMIFFFIFIDPLSCSHRITIIVSFEFACPELFFSSMQYSLVFGNQSYPSIIIEIYVQDDPNPSLL